MKFRDADGIPKGIDGYCTAYPNEMVVGAMSLDMMLKAYGLDPPIGASADAAAAAVRRKK